MEIGLIARLRWTPQTYGNVQGSRDHSSATALHHVFTTVYDTWGDSRPTAAKKAAATPKRTLREMHVHMTANSAVLRLFRTTGQCNSVIQRFCVLLHTQENSENVKSCNQMMRRRRRWKAGVKKKRVRRATCRSTQSALLSPLNTEHTSSY